MDFGFILVKRNNSYKSLKDKESDFGEIIKLIKSFAWFHWQEWSSWSDCSAQGIKTRSRECPGVHCFGEVNATETKNCEVNPGLQFYLDTNGSDSFDGTSSVHLDGTNSGPWASLSHAISQIRTNRPHIPGPEDLATLYILTGQSSWLTV